MNKVISAIQHKTEDARHQWRLRNAIRSIDTSGFYFYPEPPSPGDYAAGLSLLNGDIFESYQISNLSADSVWNYNYPSEHLIDRMHSFEWMDDLASVKTHEANRKIRAWTYDWIENFGRGTGPGWRVDLLAMRVLRLVTHSSIMLENADLIEQERFLETLSIQAHYLSNAIDGAEEGLPKFAAIIASIYASLSLNQFKDETPFLLEELEDQCSILIKNDEIILHSRCPEELSQIFCLLVWCDELLEQVDLQAKQYHDYTIDITGRAVRALRFGERTILPANGGGEGNSIEVERALSQAQIQGAMYDSEILGFRHIRAGALTAFFDCSEPASGSHYDKTHASTLGLWVAERNQVLIGAGGSAVNQPVVKCVEMQETRAHSTTVVHDVSSSELTLKKDKTGKYTIGATIAHPAHVSGYSFEDDTQSINIEATHDGYRHDFGYLHTRKLLFDRDGLYIGGIDILQCQDARDEKKVNSILAKRGRNGIPVDIYFHLGPKIKPIMDKETEEITFSSQMGNSWVFRQEGGKIEISEYDYYISNRFKPVRAYSIAIRTRLVGASGFVTWSLQAFNR